MSFKNKKHITSTLLASSTAPQSVIVQTHDKQDFAIGLKYGAGSSTTAKLQASVNGTDYSDVSNSSQTLDNAGGNHIWNVTGFESPYLKIVVTGDAVTCVITISQSI